MCSHIFNDYQYDATKENPNDFPRAPVGNDDGSMGAGRFYATTANTAQPNQRAEGSVSRTFRAADEVARDGVLRLLPLRNEHLHRTGVGQRRRKCKPIRTNAEARPRAVAATVQKGRDERRHRRGEAPRRILPLAHADHRPPLPKLVEQVCERDEYSARLRRSSQEAGHEIRFLRVAVGQKQCLLRHRPVRDRRFPAPVFRAFGIRHRPV